MDKYLIWAFVFIILGLFGWLYANTCQLTNYAETVKTYESRIDSLETRVGQLEYFIENEPKQIIVNVNSKIQK